MQVTVAARLVSALHSFQPPQQLANDSQCPGTDAFKCNGEETPTLRSKTNGKMRSHSDTVQKEAQSWMRTGARETESVVLCTVQ